MMSSAARPKLLATAVVMGFFFLLLWFYVSNVYGQHFFDHGGIVVAWQAARIVAIPYLLWLQYAVGAWVLRRMQKTENNMRGMPRFIAAFLLGTSLWHIVLFALGLAGLLFYPVTLLLAGGVMIASWPQLCNVLQQVKLPRALAIDEKMMTLLVVLAAITFVLLKGAYPSGGHDFFNHYFSYYKEVIASGNLGPHASWYQYYYSKGLGMYFLSMILLDPLAIHLVGTTFVAAAAAMVFHFLRKHNASLLLPLFGVFLYLMCYIYTSGRGLFAANGGWGDLEKTHELTAVLLLGCIWLSQQFFSTRDRRYAWALYATCIANVIIGFASGILAGIFFTVLLVWCIARKDMLGARVPFFAGVATGISMVAMLLINYINTGLPQDQLIEYVWDFIDWKKVVAQGYTLELYAHLYTNVNFSENTLPLLQTLPKMLVEYYRFYMLWPLLAIGGVLYASRLNSIFASNLLEMEHPQKHHVPDVQSFFRYPFLRALLQKRVNRGALKLEGSLMILLFLISSYILAVFFGGRTQFISFFRFSTFNYVPTLIIILLLWRLASPLLLRAAVWGSLVVGAVLIVWAANINPPDEGKVTFPLWAHFKVGEWKKLGDAAWNLNSGEASLYDAIRNQHGRVGRMKWGGIHPSMRILYSGLPPKTRVWSLYNHSYCLLPDCNMQQYFSQITSPRWYDITLGSIEDGKKIMQEEGLNFFFYSRNINTVFGSDAKDQLSAFYKGFHPENIDSTFGILWTNGWDYLLTWKEQSTAPLDQNFLDSWRGYYEASVAPRALKFPVDKLAVMVKKAVEDPSITHPPRPEW